MKILYLTQERTLTPQAQGGVPLAEAAARAEQAARSSRATSTPSTSAAAPTASRRRRRPTSTSDAKDLDAASRARCWRRPQQPDDFDPANGKDTEAALKERYHYVLDGDGRRPGTITADGGRPGPKQRCRSSRRSRRESQYGGQKGHMLRLVKQRAARSSGFTDERDRRRRPAGHHDVHPEGDGRPPRRA